MLHKAVFISGAVLLLLLFCGAGQVRANAHDKVYNAEKFDVAALVNTDNTMRVTETEVFDFSGGTFSFVTRELPTDNTDGISVLSAGIDGQAAAQGGTSSGQYEVESGNPIKITWHFVGQSGSTHTFTLTYLIHGIVQKQSGEDLIDWKPLPDKYPYTIASSTITISYPASARLKQRPEVDEGAATISTSGNIITYHASNLPSNQGLELGQRFFPGLVQTAPDWQQAAARNNALIPYTLPLGLLIAVGGSIIGTRRYRRYRRPSQGGIQLAAMGITTPPGDLPPAIAGVLATTNDASPSWQQALATIFSLMDRGVIALAPPSIGGWLLGSSDFNLMLLNVPPDLRPHEGVLLNMLFERSGNIAPLVGIKKAGEKYRSKSGEFQKALQAEMAAMGMIDLKRKEVASSLGCVTTIVFFLALAACFIIPIIGLWPLIFVPIGVIIICIALFIARSGISVYTEGAYEAALPWKAFVEYIRLLTIGQGALGAEYFASYLAYATSFGFLPKWARTMEQFGMLALPPWFGSLVTAGYIQNQHEAMSEFGRMSESAHHAGESSSGGGSNMSGSSGAAGGGSSSAG